MTAFQNLIELRLQLTRRHWVAAIFLMAAVSALAQTTPSEQIKIADHALTPGEEQSKFKLPPGFEIELVAAESEGIGKFITVDWDARMRLWTMTALEYPVDANENQAASDALFASGGRDQVLVFDDPYAAPSAGPAKPRVFAANLVMPLGILPYRDGALVQYGADIRFYRDTDGDGRADRHEVVLTGFGTQDSHLFPHQFMRQPGGWIFAAQGLFNYSNVRRPDGKPFPGGETEIPFNQCRLARFTPDGSQFENLTTGPNNIWGLVTSREGETFFQEANDLGIPVVPYEAGVMVRTGTRDKLRPYQPLMPPTLDPPQMGGTGLSGLALAENRDGFLDHGFVSAPASKRDPATKVFYLANPITSMIQMVRATPDGPRYRYEKLPDFITTTDHWFRPVALHFGPDGCLYIVDWYNKIISHNEVPRTHPDRDKTRGRIWRVRHQNQPRATPPDLTKLSDRELTGLLGGPNALVSRRAWLEITDRNAASLAPGLEKIAADATVAADRRLAALWALEGIALSSSLGNASLSASEGERVRVRGGIGSDSQGKRHDTRSAPHPSPLRLGGGEGNLLRPVLLHALAKEANPNFRHEAVRIAALHTPQSEFVALATPLVDDPAPRVRAALGDALRRISNPGTAVIALAAKLGREPLPKPESDWPAYDRAFERYLARWAMELQPKVVAEFLRSPKGRGLPLENRVLATVAMGGREAAVGLAQLIPELKRPFDNEEVRLLASNFGEPEVAEVLGQALGQPDARRTVLRSLLTLRTSLDSGKLTPALTVAANGLLTSSSVGDQTLGVEVARAFMLAETEPELVALLKRGWSEPQAGTSSPISLSPESLAALRALRDIASGPADLFEALAVRADDAVVRDAALGALAASKSPGAGEQLVKLLPLLPPAERQSAMERLANGKAGAAALVAGLQSGSVESADLNLRTLEKLQTLLPDNSFVGGLWRNSRGEDRRVLRLAGGKQDFADSKITLIGAFTVECWAKLDPDISNRDGILGAPGQLDMNFHDARFRVWVNGSQHDIVIAKRKTTPGSWTHYAVTRDEAGTFRIYVNGELDGVGESRSTNTFAGLDVGRTIPETGGAAGWLAEFRVWNTARTPEQIRANFDRSFQGEAGLGTLTRHFAGTNWGKLSGKSRVELSEDAPALLTSAEAQAQAEKFARFRALAERPGNAAQGRELFTTACLVCHQAGGQGGQIAPALDGAGLTGVEAMLRNILTPNAAMEGGYRLYRVETRDDELLDGLFVSEDAQAIVLRQQGQPDKRILRTDVKRSGFRNLSVMPEGLLEAMQPEQVSDLFAHLKTLR